MKAKIGLNGVFKTLIFTFNVNGTSDCVAICFNFVDKAFRIRKTIGLLNLTASRILLVASAQIHESHEKNLIVIFTAFVFLSIRL